MATLGCAFLLVMTAAVGVVLAITSESNQLEAQRQRERIDAAIENQVRWRRLSIENMVETGLLQPIIDAGLPSSTLEWAFTQIASRFLAFDGVYLVKPAGQVIVGIDGGKPAGQTGYDALHAYRKDLPGTAGRRVSTTSSGEDLLTHADGKTIAMIVASLARPGDASPAEDATFIVGYRWVTDAVLSELGKRYRVAGIRITTEAPADPSLQKPIASATGEPAAWLTWTAERPGDVMIRHFLWALLAIALIFAFVFAFAFVRMRSAAAQIAYRERQIQRLASQDELSDLPNRRVFDRRLDQELAQLGRTKGSLAVLLLDLDRFKAVNDTYGHNAGDELIRQVAQRLVALLRTGDTVARLGGDEFGIIQTNTRSKGASVALGQRILDTLRQPFEIGGVSLTIGCSIGIAHAPQDAEDREAIMRQADTALYEAKNEGKNRYSIFEPQMNRSLQLKRVVEEDLRRAIANDELLLHYQPQVSIDGTTIVGVEALVRWPHPLHGMVPPSEFIGIAEERGLIVPLSEWVLRRACLEAKRWEGLRLAVNVSPIQFRHKDFVSSIVRIVEETGFDPARLELELTEGVVVDDADAAENAMMDLRAHGIGLALDDFGTGYSSLIYLRRFAFDKIKIDRSFLEYMETTGESAILVHSVVHLGRALGLRVCAEGVETAEQHRFLQAIGCHELQGFLFSKAVPPDEIDRLLKLDLPFQKSLAA